MDIALGPAPVSNVHSRGLDWFEKPACRVSVGMIFVVGVNVAGSKQWLSAGPRAAVGGGRAQRGMSRPASSGGGGSAGGSASA